MEGIEETIEDDSAIPQYWSSQSTVAWEVPGKNGPTKTFSGSPSQETRLSYVFRDFRYADCRNSPTKRASSNDVNDILPGQEKRRRL
jgi:hypothetical protein